MKFYDRENEKKLIKKLKKGFCIAVTGRRRVGKTRLIKEVYPKSIYLHIPEEKNERILARDLVEFLRKDIYIPDIPNLNGIIEYLIEKTDRVIIIDEVQNLQKISQASISHLQRIIDNYKETVKLVVCGSNISVMKKIFTDNRSPLFGRMDLIINLRELSFNIAS